MVDKVQKIREVIEKRYKYWREKEFNSHSIESEIRMSECQHLLLMLDPLQEEPVSDGLEEACEQLAENARKHKAETSSPFFSQTDYRQGVIDGAKWQKEQMMTKAFDGEILENYDGKVIKYDDTILDEKLSDCKVFDKVKIIVIKED